VLTKAANLTAIASRTIVAIAAVHSSFADFIFPPSIRTLMEVQCPTTRRRIPILRRLAGRGDWLLPFGLRPLRAVLLRCYLFQFLSDKSPSSVILFVIFISLSFSQSIGFACCPDINGTAIYRQGNCKQRDGQRNGACT
jgi:hypothetical protein